MEGGEARAQDLPAPVEMVQVGAGEARAGGASAAGLDRPDVVAVAAVADAQHPVPDEEVAVARVAGREHAVEEVHPPPDRLHDVLRGPHPHEVAGRARRHVGREPVEHLEALLHRLAHREPADRVAVEPDGAKAGQRLGAKVRPRPALHDAEEGGGAVPVGGARPVRPPEGAAHGFGRRGPLGRPRGALVEHHHHVGAEVALDLHRPLGVEADRGAVPGRAEVHPFLAHPASQAEDLEPARVGEDRAVPGHHAVQAPVGAHPLGSGAEHQVEGVADDDPGPARPELRGVHRPHGGAGPDRHERGGLHGVAPAEPELAAPGVSVPGEHAEAVRVHPAAGLPDGAGG